MRPETTVASGLIWFILISKSYLDSDKYRFQHACVNDDNGLISRMKRSILEHEASTSKGCKAQENPVQLRKNLLSIHNYEIQ
jgi:hypothetical protein